MTSNSPFTLSEGTKTALRTKLAAQCSSIINADEPQAENHSWRARSGDS